MKSWAKQPPSPKAVIAGALAGDIREASSVADLRRSASSASPLGAGNGLGQEQEEEEEESEDDRNVLPGAVPKRLSTPLEKDMWNQSMYLPHEFTNPPERMDPNDLKADADASFPVSPRPPTEEEEAEAGAAKSESTSARASTIAAGGGGVSAFASSTSRKSAPSSNHPLPRSGKRETLRYFCTMLTWELFFRVLYFLIGLCLLVVSILIANGSLESPPPAATGGVLLWRWLAFAATVILSIPFSRLVVRLSEVCLWYAHPQWTTSAYYYVKCCRRHIGAFLATIGWLVAWYVFVSNVASPASASDQSFFYGTQVFWLCFIASLLVLFARLARELSASYFEKTTYWTLVSESLKREYFTWACCPGCPVPSPVVLTYHRAGEDAIRSDPRVLRQCTKYLRRQFMTGYNNVHPGSLTNPLANVNAPIEITHPDEVQDLTEIIFDHVWHLIYGDWKSLSIEEDTTRVLLRQLKQNRTTGEASVDSTLRSMFTAGHVLLQRSASSAHVPGGNVKPSSASSSLLIPPSSRPGHALPPPLPLPTIIAAQPQQPHHAVKPARHALRRILQHDFERKMFNMKEEHGVDPLQVWATIFDPNKRGFCTPKYLKTSMLRFHNERVGLGHTLKDSQAAVDRLGSVYYSLAFVGIIISAALLFAGASSYNVWIGITSFFVTLAVVFGSTLKSIAENIVFIFFRHPYDVGDLLFFENNYYSVRRLELLSTTLIKWNGQYLQISNLQLSEMQILNLSRSGLYWEVMEAHVDIATCTSQFLVNVRQHMASFIQTYPDSYSGKFQVIARSVGRPLQIRVAVYVEFSFRPVNLTRLFDDIGRITECFTEALRCFSATEAGVGLGAVRANGDAPVQFLVPANGLFARVRAVSEAVGLSS